jgi:hypothetical protein
MKIPNIPQIPAGQYLAKLLEIKQTEHESYGPGWCWLFEITKGKYAGQTVQRTTAGKATKANATGKFMVALSRLSYDEAIKRDMDDFVGTECALIVSESESGFSRVESFVATREPGDDSSSDPFGD